MKNKNICTFFRDYDVSGFRAEYLLRKGINIDFHPGLILLNTGILSRKHFRRIVNDKTVKKRSKNYKNIFAYSGTRTHDLPHTRLHSNKRFLKVKFEINFKSLLYYHIFAAYYIRKQLSNSCYKGQ